MVNQFTDESSRLLQSATLGLGTSSNPSDIKVRYPGSELPLEKPGYNLTLVYCTGIG